MPVTVPTAEEHDDLVQRVTTIEEAIQQVPGGEAPPPDLSQIIQSLQELTSKVNALEGRLGLDLVMWNSGNSSERRTSIPVNPTNASPHHAIYSLNIGAVKAGDIFDIAVEFQVTNDSGAIVAFGAYTALTGGMDVKDLSLGGAWVTEENGDNVTPQIHHHKRVVVGTLEITQAIADSFLDAQGAPRDAWFNILAYSMSTASTPGMILKIDQDSGRLCVKRFRKIAPSP